MGMLLYLSVSEFSELLSFHWITQDYLDASVQVVFEQPVVT